MTRPAFPDGTIKAVARVLDSGFVTQGPETARFEKEAAEFLGGGMVTAVSSGSAALFVALKAVGVGRGDQVLVPAFSHPAPAYAVVMAGGIPVPVDADPDTLGPDFDAIPKLVTSVTKAIVVVDGLGVPAPVRDLLPLAEQHHITIIEDAACALGADNVARHADVATFSLHPRKVITSGEGGFVFTRDAHLDAEARRVRNFGLQRRGFGPVFDGFGFNFRFNDILAAIAREQLKFLPEFRKIRARLVARYLELLDRVNTVRVPAGMRIPGQAFQTMAVWTPIPGPEIVELMANKGVEVSATAHNLAAQPFFQDLWSRLDMSFHCPVAENLASHLIALPLGVDMTNKDVDFVVTALKEAIDESTRSGD